eukprot:GDKJ01050129.1.p1 GENE.GDKJ01050129.1~~GDKJ01050129.1.p1  ORF type:complete len:277 (+),score=76.81 GDKJ01050129.1:1-831(+)
MGTAIGMLRLSAARTFRRSTVRSSGGASEPGWNIPYKQMFEPRIPDRQYFLEHPFYSSSTLFIRGTRPRLEKVAGDIYSTLGCAYNMTLKHLVNNFVSVNSDVRLQAIAIITAVLTFTTLKSMGPGQDAEVLGELNTVRAVVDAHLKNAKGFWMTAQEEHDARQNLFVEEKARLEAIWESAYADALQYDDFNKLAAAISVDPSEVRTGLPPQFIERFELFPSGAIPETQTFPVPAAERYGGASEDYGTYVERKDNKGPSMRHSRQVFASYYQPPTK